VILSPGDTLVLPPGLSVVVPEGRGTRRGKDADTVASERVSILAALRATDGIVSGTEGAAARLGLKRTTLLARMRKLGISRGSA
jgi:transcriptional regulator with GAF, ATPase, and Fis domain